MTETRIIWDQEANAIYVRFSDDEVASTIALSHTVYIDVDVIGNPIGMEVLRVDSDVLNALKELPHKATLRDLIQRVA